jgi:hypothetical protein
MLRPYSCSLSVVRYIFFATDQLPMTNDQRLKTLLVTTPTGSLWYIASFYFAIVVVCRGITNIIDIGS